MGIFDPIDWDGDGKHDIFDDMLEFAMFEEMTKEDDFDDDFDLNFDDDFDNEQEW